MSHQLDAVGLKAGLTPYWLCLLFGRGCEKRSREKNPMGKNGERRERMKTEERREEFY